MHETTKTNYSDCSIAFISKDKASTNIFLINKSKIE